MTAHKHNFVLILAFVQFKIALHKLKIAKFCTGFDVGIQFLK